MDIQQIISDPDYQSLPTEEKRKVWSKIDPDFTGLSSDEQDKVIAKTSLPSEQLPTKPELSLGQAESIGAPHGILETLKSKYQRYVPEPIQNAVENAVTAGKYLGLDQPISAFGGPGQAIEKATQATQNAAKLLSVGKNAQRVLEEIPIRRLQLTQEAANTRDALRAAKEAEIASTEAKAASDLQATQSPAQKQIEELRLQRRNKQTELTNQQAQLAIRNKREQQALIRGRETQEVSATNEYSAKAKQLAGQNLPESKIGLGKKSEEVISNQIKASYETSRNIHKRIIEISQRPENASKAITQETTGLVDEAGKPITRAVETESPASIDMSSVKEALSKDYETIAGEINAAVNNGSPGARALKQLVEGPGKYTLEQALDIKAALNDIGYGSADSALTSKSEAIARKAAAALRSSIRGQASQFKNGGDEAIKLMDEEARVLADRDAKFGNALSRGIARRMRKGDASSIRNPVELQAWFNQVDDVTRQAGKSQVANDLLSRGPEEFGKRWNAMDLELKKMWFSPEEISKGDSIASGSKQALEKIAQDYKAAESERVMRAVENSSAIRNKRAELANMQTKIEELYAQISKAGEASTEALQSQRKFLEMKYRQKASDLRNQVADKRKEIILAQQEAQKKVDKVNRYKRFGWYVAGATLGSMAYYRFRGAYYALTGD